MAFLLGLLLLLLLPASAAASDPHDDAADPLSSQELAQALENPLADLFSLALETTWDVGAGPEDAHRVTLEVNPVVPFDLGEDWLLVTRSFVPLVHQQALEEEDAGVFGLGDIETSLFVTPRSTFLGAAWGLGPVLLFPAATDSSLGADAWAAGPAGVVVTERGPWSAGVIAHHLWSYLERGDERVRATLLDPWLNHAWESGFSVTLECEAGYDWEAEEWTVPIGAAVHQLVAIGAGRRIDLGLEFLHVVERTPDDPTWSVTVTVDLLFEREGR